MIAGGLLGLAFFTFGINHFLNFIPMGDPPAEGSPAALFFGAIHPTGYLSMIKAFEIVGASWSRSRRRAILACSFSARS